MYLEEVDDHYHWCSEGEYTPPPRNSAEVLGKIRKKGEQLGELSFEKFLHVNTYSNWE